MQQLSILLKGTNEAERIQAWQEGKKHEGDLLEHIYEKKEDIHFICDHITKSILTDIARIYSHCWPKCWLLAAGYGMKLHTIYATVTQ